MKPKDYACGENIQGDNPYNIWKNLSIKENPLCPGDLLELVQENSSDALGTGDMWIAKYIGFEPAEWYVAEAPQSQIVHEQEAAPNTVPETEGCPS